MIAHDRIRLIAFPNFLSPPQIIQSCIKNVFFPPAPFRSFAYPFRVCLIRSLELEEKIDLLIRGQAWVARKIEEFRFQLPAGSPYLFLEAIKVQHQENVETLKNYSIP